MQTGSFLESSRISTRAQAAPPQQRQLALLPKGALSLQTSVLLRVMASRQADQPEGLGKRTGKGFPLKLTQKQMCLHTLQGEPQTVHKGLQTRIFIQCSNNRGQCLRLSITAGEQEEQTVPTYNCPWGKQDGAHV